MMSSYTGGSSLLTQSGKWRTQDPAEEQPPRARKTETKKTMLDKETQAALYIAITLCDLKWADFVEDYNENHSTNGQHISKNPEVFSNQIRATGGDSSIKMQINSYISRHSKFPHRLSALLQFEPFSKYVQEKRLSD